MYQILVYHTYHTIMHDLIPIFTGNYTKQSKNTIGSCFEVSLSTDCFTMLNGPEEDDSHKGIEKYQQKHSHYNEKGLVD